MSKCDSCTHKEICVHKVGFDSFAKRINDALPGEEMQGMGDKYPFRVVVSCRYFVEQEKIIRDRLLQQQYSSVGSNVKMPNNPNFYGYGRDEN